MSLLDAFVPRREQLLLRALVLNPDQSFSVNDLVRVGGGSRSAAATIIEGFAKSNLLTEERVGNQRRLQFNGQWPLALELRQMFVKSFGVAEPIREALTPLADRIERAFIFGSIARRADHAGSDIDLMVVCDVSTLELLKVLEPLKDVLKRPVNFNLYMPAEWAVVQSDLMAASIVHGPRVVIFDCSGPAESSESLSKGPSQRGT